MFWTMLVEDGNKFTLVSAISYHAQHFATLDYQLTQCVSLVEDITISKKKHYSIGSATTNLF